MSVIQTVRTLLDRGPSVVVECRNCGTTLDTEAESCPCCGEADTNRFEIE